MGLCGGILLRVDPIAGDFPWVSPYNYAENRPIDGIDLWGLQYVSVNDAFFRVEGLQTWFDTDQHLSGIDLIGREYIGTSAPLRVVNFSLPEGHPVFSSEYTIKCLDEKCCYLQISGEGLFIKMIYNGEIPIGKIDRC